MVMSMRSSSVPMLERRAVLRLFISEKPRSQTEVSTARQQAIAQVRTDVAEWEARREKEYKQILHENAAFNHCTF